MSPAGPTSPLRGLLRRHRIVIAGVSAIVLALGIGFPIAVSLDDDIDVQRVTFDDAATMVELQTALTGADQSPQALDVRGGEQVSVGDQTFTPHAGNRVTVLVSDDGFCVQVRNDDPAVPATTYDSVEGRNGYDGIRGGACGD